MLIIIEGIDKLGKTTAIKDLESYYKKKGIKVHVLNDFYTDYGKMVKRIFLDMRTNNKTRLELVRCARNDMIDNVLSKLNLSNDIIIMDRFIFSTIIYQNMNISNFEVNTPEINLFWRYKSYMRILLVTTRYINNNDPKLKLSAFEKRYRTEETQNNFRKVLSQIAKQNYKEILVEKFVTAEDLIKAIGPR